MTRLIFLCLLVFSCSIQGLPPAYAQVFNNIPLSETELNAAVERSFAMGTTQGFSGVKPYSVIELLNVYHERPDSYIYRYIKRDLMEVGLSPDGKTSSAGFYLQPLYQVQARGYLFNTTVPNKTGYCLENTDGNCLDDGFTSFLNVMGQGRLHKNVTFLYEGQLKVGSESTQGTLNLGYVKIKTGKLVWEIGRDSIWLGQGSHGSFLLSNNAESFWLFKVQTEEPFRLPFFLSKLGEFQYTLFHGWLDDWNILGHRLAWKPFDILEFGVNETVVYDKDKDIHFWDWPKLFWNTEENIPGAKYNNDVRASLDVALYMPFLSKVPYLGLKGGKIYAEYGGEDSYAWWQEEDGTWYGPVGFEFLGQGIMLGLFLTTGETDFRVEYAETYRSYPIFWDWYKHNGIDYPSKGETWYMTPRFLNDGVLMGHHCGRECEDIYFEVKHRFDNFFITAFYDQEKHHLYTKIDQFNIFKTTPEKRYQYGLKLLYALKNLEFSGIAIYNRYKNVDTNPDPLDFNIVPGKTAHEFVTGLGVKYLW